MFLNEIKYLLWKDLIIEWRQKYALNGILLYLISSIFVVYLTFNLKQETISPQTWNALFWIIMLFSSVNGVAKSFIQDSEGRHLYYYILSSPQAIIVSKTIYNFLLTILLAFSGLAFYSLIMGSSIPNVSLFLVNILLACMGISFTLTLVSGIASKANSSATLMAILSFPIMLPVLLMVIRISGNALNGLDWSVSYNELTILVSINFLIGAVSYLLFPYLWRS